jgi:hypothetical protein
MTFDIVHEQRGVIEVRARTPAYADYLHSLLSRHGHAVTHDRTNPCILFVKDPHLTGFRTADQLIASAPPIQRQLVAEVKQRIGGTSP